MSYDSSTKSSDKVDTQELSAVNKTFADGLSLCMNDLQHQFNERESEVWKTNLHQLGEEWIFNSEIEQAPANQEENTRAGRFFLALSKAGFFSKESEVKSDHEALKLLQIVHLEDPDNSAPLLYMGLIERKRNNLTKANFYYSEAKKTHFFNSYLREVTRGVYRLVDNPHQYITALAVNASLPIPKYNELRDWLIEQKDPFFAYQLIENGLNPQNVKEFVDWIAIEYATGYAVLKKLGLQKNLPNFRLLSRQKSDPDQVILDNIFNRSKSQTCQLNDFLPLVENIKRR